MKKRGYGQRLSNAAVLANISTRTIGVQPYALHRGASQPRCTAHTRGPTPATPARVWTFGLRSCTALATTQASYLRPEPSACVQRIRHEPKRLMDSDECRVVLSLLCRKHFRFDALNEGCQERRPSR